MTSDSAFHPYKIIQQSGGSLQLQATARLKLVRLIYLAGPILLLGAGIVLYITQHEPVFLYTLGGVAVAEGIIFSFIKTPGTVKMDAIGFTLQTISIKGAKDSDYLWGDVDYIQHRIRYAKNNTSLIYQAIFNNGKQLTFLIFPGRAVDQQKLAVVNSTLSTISKKEVKQKI